MHGPAEGQSRRAGWRRGEPRGRVPGQAGRDSPAPATRPRTSRQEAGEQPGKLERLVALHRMPCAFDDLDASIRLAPAELRNVIGDDDTGKRTEYEHCRCLDPTDVIPKRAEAQLAAGRAKAVVAPGPGAVLQR